MRMWMVNPRIMCDQHLIGEHVELHMIVGALRKGKKLTGFVNLIEVGSLNERHEALANEMERRGKTHESPLVSVYEPFGMVDRAKSLRDLVERCEACAERARWEGEI